MSDDVRELIENINKVINELTNIFIEVLMVFYEKEKRLQNDR